MRLALHLLDPKSKPLQEQDARNYMVFRLCQLFRGWTWEYAEHLVEDRPDAVKIIFDASLAQIRVNEVSDRKFDWWV